MYEQENYTCSNGVNVGRFLFSDGKGPAATRV